MFSNLRTVGWLIIALMTAGCSGAPKNEAPPAETVPMRRTEANSGGMAVGHSTDSTVGSEMSAPGSDQQPGGKQLDWTAPGGWKAGPERPMRAATYLVPPASGDTDGAECAIFLNIGGGVQANIDRWIGQFSQPDGSPSAGRAKQRRETINGLGVSFVELNGTFNSGGMGMGGPTTPRPGYRLLGAIVESTNGEVFFKLTGPEKTVNAAAKDFQSLIRSIR